MDRQKKKNLKLKYIEITKPSEKNNSLSLKQAQRARTRRGKTSYKEQVQVMETGVTHTKLSKTHNVANRGKAWNGCCKEDRKQPDVKCEEGGEESVYAANSHWTLKLNSTV